MFRSILGFKAQYHYLTLVVVSEFDEWKTLIHGPSVSIHGTRQFGETKAKDHALTLARSFIHDQKHEDLPVLPDVQWDKSSPDDWIIWRA